MSKNDTKFKKSKPKKSNQLLITSYYHLNKKYNLNFSDNNFGFNWDIFKKFVGKKWAFFYTTKCFYKWAPTARLTKKSWGGAAFKLFLCCNFSDVSFEEIRRYENTHPITTISAYRGVCKKLKDNFNIDLGPENTNGIIWKLNKDGGYIQFPSGQKIDFMGYDNGNKIFGRDAGESGFLGTRSDEILMSEEKESLTPKELFNRYERIEDTLFRSTSLKTSLEPILEWDWDVIDDNELSPTYGQNIKRYFHKLHFMTFTCNPYDKGHALYKKYVTPYLPLNERVKNALKKTGDVWLEDQELFEGLGLFIQRFTLKPFWDDLPDITKKLILKKKKTNPSEFETIFYGFEYLDDDMSTFVYRQSIKKIQPYKLENFKTKNEMYKFDFYSIGIDWATGSEFYTISLPFGFKEIENTGYYAIYFLCELAAGPNDFLDENEKIAQYIEEFSALNNNFVGFENTFYHYDHNAETAISVIQKGLIDKYNFFIKKSKAIKHRTNVHNEAARIDRVIWLRSLFSSGYVFANKEDIPVTWEMLEELLFSKTKTNLPDEKMLHDAVDAIFYAWYPYRNMLPNKNVNLKNKTPILNA